MQQLSAKGHINHRRQGIGAQITQGNVGVSGRRQTVIEPPGKDQEALHHALGTKQLPANGGEEGIQRVGGHHSKRIVVQRRQYMPPLTCIHTNPAGAGGVAHFGTNVVAIIGSSGASGVRASSTLYDDNRRAVALALVQRQSCVTHGPSLSQGSHVVLHKLHVRRLTGLELAINTLERSFL